MGGVIRISSLTIFSFCVAKVRKIIGICKYLRVNFIFFYGKAGNPEFPDRFVNPEGRRRSAYLPTVQQRAAAINANNGGKNATERDNYQV